jgi:hypothetical protein
MTPRTRRILWLVLGGLAALKVGLDLHDVFTPFTVQRPGPAALQNRLRLGARGLTVEIPIHPPAEFDGKTRAQILAAREREVARFPQLLDGPYRPYAGVFEAIDDRRPWWGLIGLYHGGPGPHAADGLSDQSRYVLNPFLLAGLREGRVFGCGEPPPGAEAHPPVVRRLQWTLGPSPVVFEEIDLAPYLDGFDLDDQPAARTLDLILYNARDFGFRSFAIDVAASRNVTPKRPGKRPWRLTHLLHTGHSCGLPGGCTNVSPGADEYEIRVDALPATLVVNLWQALPAGAGARPDLVVVMELPGPQRP